VKSVADHVRILHNHVQCRPQLCVTGSTSCIASSGAGYGGVGLSVASVASHVSSGASVTSGAGRRDCCGMRRRGPSRCMRFKSRGPGFTYPDLAPRPSAGRFDCLPRPIVVQECLLEVGQDALGAIGGPGSLCPAVPHQDFFGALLLAAVCHGYPSVRLQVRQGRMMIPMSRSKI